MNRLLSLLCILSLVSCGYDNKNKNVQPALNTKLGIMGGTLVQEQEPLNTWIVGIYDQKDRSFCTGSLIANNFVLTAAHCVTAKPSHLKIVFGLDLDAIMTTHEQDIFRTYTRSIVGYKVHPNYRSNKQQEKDTDWGDIAIIKFSGSLPPGYQPVPLLPDDSILKRGLQIAVAGYGVSQVDVEPVDASKMKDFDEAVAYGEVLCDDDSTRSNCVKVDMSGEGVLQKTKAFVSSVQETEFRLDESKGQGTCSGDSGGPAFVEQNGQAYLVGVTSRGSPLCNDTGVYTNAVYYKDWIFNIINQAQ
ncbi:MAG: S1 family peptidase [Bdellovibrio sp.]